MKMQLLRFCFDKSFVIYYYISSKLGFVLIVW